MEASHIFVTMLLVVCALTVATGADDGGITCGEVAMSMRPCVPYLLKGGPVPAPCCSGMRSLNEAAKTTVDQQKTCECLKSAADNIPDLKNELAAALPDACGVDIPYEFTTKTDCNSIE